MRSLPKLITILTCLLPFTWLAFSSAATPGTDWAERSGLVSVRHIELIQAPVHLPPQPDCLAIRQSESEIDEEDPDQVENSIPFSCLDLENETPHRALPCPGLGKSQRSTMGKLVVAYLRC